MSGLTVVSIALASGAIVIALGAFVWIRVTTAIRSETDRLQTAAQGLHSQPPQDVSDLLVRVEGLEQRWVNVLAELQERAEHADRQWSKVRAAESRIRRQTESEQDDWLDHDGEGEQLQSAHADGGGSEEVQPVQFGMGFDDTGDDIMERARAVGFPFA